MKQTIQLNLKRILVTAIIIFAVIFNVAAQATLKDFQEASSQQGCASIPYESLRNRCVEMQGRVNSECITPRSCEDLNPQGLKEQIRNVTEKISDLGRQKDNLQSQKSQAQNDNDKQDFDNKINDIVTQMNDLQNKIAQWNSTLQGEKETINNNINVGQKCLEYRQNVQQVFKDAKYQASNESDPEIKTIAATLIRMWENGESGHADAISNTEQQINKCKNMLSNN
jgi:hypothetical protein